MAAGQHRGNLRGRARQHDDHRRLPVGGERVGLVGFQFVGVVDHTFARNERSKSLDDLVPPDQHAGIRLRHLHDATSRACAGVLARRYRSSCNS